MWSLFNRKQESVLPTVADFSFIGTDMHSHLVPGIDDGSPDVATSIGLIKSMYSAGYRKLIATPHVHCDFYDNTIDKIKRAFGTLQAGIAHEGLDVTLGVAAEYYLDTSFLMQVIQHGLLHFGENYVLVEVSMAGWPRQFDEMIFQIQSKGYIPVMAHPERYLFESRSETFLALKDRGLKMQLNLLSVTGYYGREVKELAEQYLSAGLYDMLGSDVHHERHARRLLKMPQMQPEMMQRLFAAGFINATL